MIRCYAGADAWTGGRVELDEAESKHLVGVMRAREGTRIELLDGAGRVAEAEVAVVDRRRAVARILAERVASPWTPRRILGVALVREQKMDWLIQKAVELGVHAIWPMTTARSVVKLRGPDAAKKTARWRAIALGACKQSGNPWLPEIAEPRGLAEAVAALGGVGGCFGALQEGATPMADYFARLRQEGRDSVGMLVGPEGDFGPGEVELLLGAGMQPVSLGPIVLRVETAATVMLAGVQYEWSRSPTA